jgi:hypothetical protein
MEESSELAGRRFTMSRWITVPLVVATVLVANGQAAAESRYSGTVRAIQEFGIALEEMGPWTPARTGLAERRIMVTPDTQIELAQRQDENATTTDPAAWPGGFAVRRVDLHMVRPGDFVTVVADGQGPDRLVATRIVVVQSGGEGSALPSQSR